MGFDAERFAGAGWQRRDSEIPVPTLQDFFGEGEKAVWKVQSLEGHELARAKHAKERNIRLKANIESIAEVLSTKNTNKLKESILGIIGNVESEGDTAWRTEILILGSVDPIVDYPLAALIHKARPTEYYNLTNEIIRLSGLGHEPGKPKPSGGTKKSKAH